MKHSLFSFLIKEFGYESMDMGNDDDDVDRCISPKPDYQRTVFC